VAAVRLPGLEHALVGQIVREVQSKVKNATQWRVQYGWNGKNGVRVQSLVLNIAPLMQPANEVVIVTRLIVRGMERNMQSVHLWPGLQKYRILWPFSFKEGRLVVSLLSLYIYLVKNLSGI